MENVMTISTLGHSRQLVLAGIAAIGLIGPANALTEGTVPVGSALNDVLGTADGWFGAQLFATGNLSITYTQVGFEAGFHDSFSAAGVSPLFISSGGQAGTLTAPTGPSATFNVLAGLLDFAFQANLPSGPTVINGSNPDLKATGTTLPNFWVSFFDSSGVQTAAHLGAFLGGTAGVIALDDGGAGPDHDFDDLVIKFQVNGPGSITGAPEPSTWAMLLIGFAGLGFLGYRRRSNDAAFRLA
jgi:hypothetical protein